MRMAVHHELWLFDGTVLDFKDMVQLAELSLKLIKKGNFFLAYKLTTLVDEQTISEHPSLAFARAYALTTQRIYQPARALLDQVIESFSDLSTDPKKIMLWRDIQALRGKTFKAEGMPLRPGEKIYDRNKLVKAIECYERTSEYYTDGFAEINLAFLHLLLGNHDASQTHAQLAYQMSQKRMKDASEAERGWLIVTKGEAAFILGEEDEAKCYYGEFRVDTLKNDHIGDFLTSFRQLEFIVGAMGRPIDDARQILRPPAVAVFVGHLIDKPDDNRGVRFPESVASEVKQKISEWLEKEDVEFGFTSAACGSDILFIEALLEKGGKPYITLPTTPNVFKQSSVTIRGNKRWERSFDRILKLCNYEIANESHIAFGEIAFEYANRLIHGGSILFSNQYGLDLKRLAVWDGKPGFGASGTSSVVTQWSKVSDMIDVIWIGKEAIAPAKRLQIKEIHNELDQVKLKEKLADPNSGLAFLLFADVRGFSELSETQLSYFVKDVLASVSAIFPRYPSIRKRNTWGDGIFIAFDSIYEAGMFALELAEIFIEQKWKNSDKLPRLAIRTALHAGPVFYCTDPITGTENCIGTHVSHAARLEPSTNENCVYVSTEFAAVWVAKGCDQFQCDYIGPLTWAKTYGVFPTYILRKKS